MLGGELPLAGALNPHSGFGSPPSPTIAGRTMIRPIWVSLHRRQPARPAACATSAPPHYYRPFSFARSPVVARTVLSDFAPLERYPNCRNTLVSNDTPCTQCRAHVKWAPLGLNECLFS